MDTNNIDFDSAAQTIKEDGSYLHRQDDLWGLYDNGESPDNPIECPNCGEDYYPEIDLDGDAYDPGCSYCGWYS